MVCYRMLVRSCNKRCDCSKRVQRQNRNRIKRVKIWLLRKSYFLLKVESTFLLVSLWRRANARNVRLYYPYWQYTDLFIFRFVSLLCLRSTLRLFLLVDFVGLQGIQDIAKTCSEKPIVIFWISCNKFMEMFFREINTPSTGLSFLWKKS